MYLATATGNMKRLEKIAAEDKRSFICLLSMDESPSMKQQAKDKKMFSRCLLSMGMILTRVQALVLKALYALQEGLGEAQPPVNYLVSLGADYVTPNLEFNFLFFVILHYCNVLQLSRCSNTTFVEILASGL